MKLRSLPVLLFVAAASLLFGIRCVVAASDGPRSSLPIVYVQVSNPLASEPGGNPGSFTIFRSGNTNTSFTLPISLAGTATNGVAYAAISTNITFAVGEESTNIVVTPEIVPGATGYKTVVLNVPRDRVNRGTAPEYNVGASSRAIVYIVYNYTNIAPKVSLLSPTNGASYLSMPNIALTATAKDSNGWITSVQFFANGVSVGTVTNYLVGDGYGRSLIIRESHGAVFPTVSKSVDSRYALVWTNVPPGAYSLTAVATDNAGLQTTSAAVQITVTPTLPKAMVRIINPANGASFPALAPINIVAAAGETNGVVNTVEFFVNGTNSIGAATNYLAAEPFSRSSQHSAWLPFYFQWTNAPIGTNALTAVVTDNNGTTATSAPVIINISTNEFHRHHWW